MADTPQTPRILAPHLSTFQHRLVRVVGRVQQLRGETAVIDAGGNIDLVLNRVCRYWLFFSGLFCSNNGRFLGTQLTTIRTAISL